MTISTPRGGWHWREWLSEFAGTTLLLLGGLSGLLLTFGPRAGLTRAIPSESIRLLLTGVILALTGLAVTISPLGRSSGGHLNPPVSVAFWWRGHMHIADLAGYLLAQLLGATAGTAIAALVWGPDANALRLGPTHAGAGIDGLETAALEALMTFVLIAGILLAVSSTRTVRWTPLVAWGLVAMMVWLSGGLTGASLNPARSIAPALLVPDRAYLWAYVVGPLAGSVAAAAFTDVALHIETRTAKLFHDSRYRSTMATSLRVPDDSMTSPAT